MEKFLFTDGMNGVIEATSLEALEKLVESAEQPDTIRIWLFSSSEWISYAAFRKLVPAPARKEKTLVVADRSVKAYTAQPAFIPLTADKQSKSKQWLKKFFFFATAAAGVLLVFNFTKIKWEKAAPLSATAAWPSNVPVMDIDSLIYEIEDTRGQGLDRSTRTNLRLRNTWPDRITLQLVAEKETSSNISRFFNIDISIDNATGFNLDNAVVKLSVWNNRKISMTDTIRFGTIRYEKPAKRELDYRYKGDSISVSFESIKAKAFNFCYAATVKNEPGSYNDRWFCKE